MTTEGGSATVPVVPTVGQPVLRLVAADSRLTDAGPREIVTTARVVTPTLGAPAHLIAVPAFKLTPAAVRGRATLPPARPPGIKVWAEMFMETGLVLQLPSILRRGLKAF